MQTIYYSYRSRKQDFVVRTEIQLKHDYNMWISYPEAMEVDENI